MPNKGVQFSGDYNTPHEHISMSLPLIEFEEDGSQIIYCPALDVSGYGKDEAEAKQSFEIVLQEFFRYTLNKKTFFNELIRLGWKVKKGHKPMTPPQMCDLLETNENFSRIFNQHDFRKFDKKIEMPVS
jgi:hypothetical protein